MLASLNRRCSPVALCEHHIAIARWDKSAAYGRRDRNNPILVSPSLSEEGVRHNSGESMVHSEASSSITVEALFRKSLK